MPDNDKCFPCSESDRLVRIETNISWIREKMEEQHQDEKEDKIKDRVLVLETHKKIATRVGLVVLPVVLATTLQAVWFFIKTHFTGE